MSSRGESASVAAALDFFGDLTPANNSTEAVLRKKAVPEKRGKRESVLGKRRRREKSKTHLLYSILHQCNGYHLL